MSTLQTRTRIWFCAAVASLFAFTLAVGSHSVVATMITKTYVTASNISARHGHLRP
jgi:hypothetical protein